MKKILLVLIVAFVIYSRFVGLDWGLPYAMHPDERNMANALQRLHCEIQNPKFQIQDCLNPHFFAYGQLPLYVGYFLVKLNHILRSVKIDYISLEEAIYSLRLISAFASIGIVWVLHKTIKLLIKPSEKVGLLIILFISTVPFSIQFAHFGTTESLLMFFYIGLVYVSLLFINKAISVEKYIFFSGLTFGLAMGTKLSSAVFVFIPIFAMFFGVFEKEKPASIFKIFFGLVHLATLTLIFFLVSSPHNLISLSELVGSMTYESGVGLGSLKVFYTRQFEFAQPYIFQITHVFPYTLGWPIFIFSIFGLFLLPFNKSFNFLRITVIIFVLFHFSLYAKWSRFIAPLYPLMLLVAGLFVGNLFSKIEKVRLWHKFFIVFLVLISIIPGIAYLSIYTNKDVRFVASNWIYQNLKKQDSKTITETANVVDIPIPDPEAPQDARFQNYLMTSFNFYELDNERQLLPQLNNLLPETDYLSIPSRRIFYNHTCYRDFGDKNSDFRKISIEIGYDKKMCDELVKMYPTLSRYYDKFFAKEYGFREVAKFTSYPRLQFFGKTILEFPDESSEETWTVFDHPVIRIYAKDI